MAVVHKFEARRSRGIVWVCDIESSSKYINSNESAEALELFLQRFLFLSLIFVEAAGGGFIMWTGDGFLAWFETSLYCMIYFIECDKFIYTCITHIFNCVELF